MCGVASQGKPGFLDQGGWFVKTYTLAYSKNGENWANYKEFGIAKVKSLVWLCFGGVSNLLRNLQKNVRFPRSKDSIFAPQRARVFFTSAPQRLLVVSFFI